MNGKASLYRKRRKKTSKKIVVPKKANNEYKIERLSDMGYQIVYPNVSYIISKSLTKDRLKLKIIHEGLRIEEFEMPKKKGQKFADIRLFTKEELLDLLIERGVEREAIENVYSHLGLAGIENPIKESTYKEKEMIAIMGRMSMKYGRPLKNIPSFNKIPSLLLTDEIRITIGQKQVSGKDGYRFVNNYSIREGNKIVREGINLDDLEVELIRYIDERIATDKAVKRHVILEAIPTEETHLDEIFAKVEKISIAEFKEIIEDLLRDGLISGADGEGTIKVTNRINGKTYDYVRRLK